MDIKNIFNCDNPTQFIKYIISVLNFTGVSMSKFYICEASDVRFLAKLSFYRKTGPELFGSTNPNIMPPVATEINILKILNEKISSANLTPCILKLIAYKNCSVLRMVKNYDCSKNKTGTIESNVMEILCSYKDLINSGLAHDRCAFLILEKCDISFDDFIKRMYGSSIEISIFKSILFQIIYTFKVIKDIYPKFRHNDLHTENIMLKFNYKYKYRPKNPNYIVYSYKKDNFYVPYFGITPKIIDFGFSILPEEGIVSSITEDKQQMYWRTENDLLILFYWIGVAVSKSDVDIFGSISDILLTLEPNGSFIEYNADNIRKLGPKIPSYAEMIANPIFDEYRKPVDGELVHKSYRGYKVN